MTKDESARVDKGGKYRGSIVYRETVYFEKETERKEQGAAKESSEADYTGRTAILRNFFEGEIA